MASIVVAGDTSGTVTLAAPAVSGTTTLTLPTTSGTVITTGSTFAGTGPAFSAYPSAAVSLSNGAVTLMTCNTEEFDVGGCYNNTGSTVTLNGLSAPAYSFCPNVAGYYHITCTTFLVASSGPIQANIQKNGTIILCASCPNNSTGVGPCVSDIVYLNGTGDYVQFSSYQVSGGTVSTLANRPDLIGFSGAMVRSA
jgi:hypothetical protein